MSDASVTFLDIGYDPVRGDEAPSRFSFRCPTHPQNRCEGMLIRAGEHANTHPSWLWDGNREAPTFSPSVNCEGCWHGYIKGGRCVDTSGNDEPG